MFQEPIRQLAHAILQGQRLQAIDIGGAGGILAHWQKFHGNTDFFLYEPHEESYKKLVEIYQGHPFSAEMNFIQEALSGKGGLRTLYMTNSPTSSSILRPNVDDERFAGNPVFEPFQEKLIRTSTLKDSLTINGIERVDLMKLDIQGAELEVLQGLDQERLDNTLAVELEVGLIDCYEGGPTIGEIQEFFLSNGFELYDMRTQRSPRYTKTALESYHQKYFGAPEHSASIASKIYEVDMLFFRSPLSLRGRADSSLLKRLMTCQCIYNFLSEAMYLITESDLASCFSPEEQSQLMEIIKVWHQANTQINAQVDTALANTNHQVWGQYAWVPYPCA